MRLRVYVYECVYVYIQMISIDVINLFIFLEIWCIDLFEFGVYIYTYHCEGYMHQTKSLI